MSNLEEEEQIKNNVIDIIKKNNIYLLRKYITENDISLKVLNTENFDILICAIEKNASLEIVQFILNQCKYESLNYYVIKDEENVNVPLYSAVGKNKFKIADLLIKNKADINYFSPDIISYLSRFYRLNPINLKYILNHGFDKQFINSELIMDLLERKKDTLLDIIFKHYIFNIDFILNLLKVYKNKEPFSDKLLNNMITNERRKILVDEEMYKKAIEIENCNSFKVLFNNDSSEQDVIFCRINEYDLLEKAVKTNDYNFVKNVLNYEPFNFKSINSKEILLNINKNNNMDIMKLLIKSSLDSIVNKQDSSSDQNYKVRYLNFILNMMIKIENMTFIKYLVEGDEFKSILNINVKDINDEYPIVTSFYSDNIDIFEYIIEHGGDCNIKNCNDNSLISLAIDKNDGKDYIKLMLNHNIIPIKEEYINGSDSIMKAINNNNINIVILLVQYGIKNNIDMNIIDRNGNTPLTLSYRLNYQNIFKFLIKYLDINKTDINGNNILYYAILKEDVETMRFLVSSGADVNSKNKLGKSNMDLIISEGYTFLNTLLNYSHSILLNVPNGQGEIPLMTIIKINTFMDEEKEDMVEKLIRRGSDVNFIDNRGNTPLVYAIKKKSLSIVKLLVKNDANINYLIPSNDQSILMYAIDIGNIDIIQLLVEYGADINFKNSKGYSALEKTFENERLEIFKYFVKYDINNFTGEVINNLIKKEKLDLLKILMENNFDINLKDENEDIPLVYAFKNRQPEIVKYLIENGADIFNKNKQGETIEYLNTKYFYEYGWQKSYDNTCHLINKFK